MHVLTHTHTHLMSKLNYPNVDHSVGSITLQRVQLKVPLKVAGVQSGDGQAVPITSLDRNKAEFIPSPPTQLNHPKSKTAALLWLTARHYNIHVCHCLEVSLTLEQNDHILYTDVWL